MLYFFYLSIINFRRLNDSSLYNQCLSPNEQLESTNDIEHQCKAMYMIGYEDNGNPKGLTVYDMEKSLVNLVC